MTQPTQTFECSHIEEKTAKAYVEYEFAFILAILKGGEAKTKMIVCRECWVNVCRDLQPGEEPPGIVRYVC